VRKFIVLLAIMAGSLFTLGASATPALAGNCTNVYNSATTYYAGLLHYGAVVGSCTAVNRVQWGLSTDTHAIDAAGWWYDGNTGALYVPTTHYNNAIQPSPAGGWEQVIFNHAPWCGGATHWVTTNFSYRIESIDPKGGLSWGPWHEVVTNGYQIVC
jgi:hypothetical protein